MTSPNSDDLVIPPLQGLRLCNWIGPVCLTFPSFRTFLSPGRHLRPWLALTTHTLSLPDMAEILSWVQLKLGTTPPATFTTPYHHQWMFLRHLLWGDTGGLRARGQRSGILGVRFSWSQCCQVPGQVTHLVPVWILVSSSVGFESRKACKIFLYDHPDGTVKAIWKPLLRRIIRLPYKILMLHLSKMINWWCLLWTQGWEVVVWLTAMYLILLEPDAYFTFQL